MNDDIGYTVPAYYRGDEYLAYRAGYEACLADRHSAAPPSLAVKRTNPALQRASHGPLVVQIAGLPPEQAFKLVQRNDGEPWEAVPDGEPPSKRYISIRPIPPTQP